MKNIKYLFLLLVIVLFTGCSVNYDLNIDNDLSVTEKVEATEKEDTVKANTGLDKDKAVDYLYNIYKRDNIDPSISTRIDGKNLVVSATTSHKSIDDYVDNFSSDLFKDVKLSKSGNLYTLTFKQSDKLSDTNSMTPIYDKVTINITLPYKVTDNNADKVYKNQYTWIINKGEETRKIKISFDTSVKNDTKTLNLGLFKINVKMSFVVLIIMLLIMSAFVAVIYTNNKKNNKV